MTKKVILPCILNGVLFGVIKLCFELSGESYSQFLYCSFLGITVTLAAGAKPEELLSYFRNLLIGLIWVGLFLGTEAVCLLLPMPLFFTKALSFGLTSFVIELTNQSVLGARFFQYPSLQFAVIIGCFSQKCSHMSVVFTALTIGICAAILSKLIYVGCARPTK
ncbi:MAG: hypothetical protein ACI3W5_12570 [Faecousia sp.]